MDRCGITVRPRAGADLGACARLARLVHDTDGYPAYVRDGDFTRFVAAPAAFAAWVAVDGGEVVGQVAAHTRTSPPAMTLAAAELGVERDHLGAVARLLVAPTARRRGVGSTLLTVARDAIAARGLVPILDVVTRHVAAIALYDRAGWERLGAVVFSLPDGSQLDELVYCAPGAKSRKDP